LFDVADWCTSNAVCLKGCFTGLGFEINQPLEEAVTGVSALRRESSATWSTCKG